MSGLLSICSFLLDGERYGLELATVERVLPAIAVRPLPGAPAIVLGLIQVGVELRPVIDLRHRFGLPEREMFLSDRLILARTVRRPVALWVDEIGALEEVPAREMVPTPSLAEGAAHVRGVVKRADGLIFIHDLDTCLSPEEEGSIDRALGKA